MSPSGLSRGLGRDRFPDLPSSLDEVHAAKAALGVRSEKVLSGPSATEAAFKQVSLAEYGIIHLAVHAFADRTHPEHAALVLLSERARSEDGFLQPAEIVQLRLAAELVVLSACDTAVGPLQGQEGIANLSRAFLLAGARNVVSTLWPIDDEFSLVLMKRFYAHLAANRSPGVALAAAKRDVLKRFGSKVLPYQWAAFIAEGAPDRISAVRRKEP
jgi:CHAT domain-containing protein